MGVWFFGVVVVVDLGFGCVVFCEDIFSVGMEDAQIFTLCL